jgi:MFS family permease
MTGTGLAAALPMLAVTSASYSLAQSMVNPALGTLRQTLHTDQVGVSWVLTSYLLASALFTPILGRLGDRHGKRRLLLIALGLLVLGSVVAAPAHALPEMVIGRVLQGAAGAVLLLWRTLPHDRSTHAGEGVNWMAALLLSAALVCLLLPLSPGFIPSFLQLPRQAGLGFGESVTASGILFVPSTLAMLVTGLFTGFLLRVMRPKAVLLSGAAPPVIGFLLLAVVRAQLWEVVTATVIAGLGFGIALSALSAVVVHAVPAAQTGAATGMNANIRTIGGALGAAVVSTILGSHTGALGRPTANGYTIAFAALAVTALGSLVACLAIPTAIEAHEPVGAGNTTEINSPNQERIIR